VVPCAARNHALPPHKPVQCGRGSKLNEDFVISATSIESMQTPPTCLSVAAPNMSFIINGSSLTTAECDSSDPLQQLAYSASTQLIVHVPTGLCVDAGSPLPPQDFCGILGHSAWTICDSNAPIDARSADIVARLSLADKIQALGTATVR
jgi:hypothetical protein